MDAGESDQDVSSFMENDEENSSVEGSEEESDGDEDEDGTDAISEGEDEDGTDALSGEDEGGTDALSGEDDEETSDEDDGDNGCEAASAAAVEEASYKEDLPNLEDPDMSCPICLNEFAGQDLGSPENCNHTFCFECIQEWSKNINTCPIDRIEFHLIYMKQEINGDVIKKVKVKVQKEVEEYVEEVTLCQVCSLGDREDRLLLCDSCDSGYHCECLDPPLETIPIEEWFCPPCSQALNRRVSSPQASHSRLIARTSASEIVRSRIQHHRTANSGDSGSETTQQLHRVRSPARAPKRRKTSKRKTKRKKTTRKSSKSKTLARTKATAAGKSKVKKVSSKTPTKRKRKTKRRKTTKKKKKSKKSWLASMKLVAPSVKKRIADHLGLCKPPPGQSMPYVKKSGGQRMPFVEQLSSLDVFGCRDQLFDFTASYSDDDLGDPKPSTSKQRIQAIASRSSMAVASTSGINLLDNILEKQNDLLQNSKNITIGKDGSLSKNEKSTVKGKCGVTSVKNAPKNEESVLEPTASSSSSSMSVQKEKDVSATDSANSKKDISDGTSSLASALSGTTKKEKPYLHPRVRFKDTETVFRIVNDDACEQIRKKKCSTPAEVEYNLLCSSPTMEGKEDIPCEKASVSVENEKVDGLLLHSLMDTEIMDTATSLDVNRDNKEHKVNVKEFHKDTSLSFSNRTCKENVGSGIDSSGTSTNKFNFPCSTDDSNSSKNISSSDSSEPVCVKMDDTSTSLFDKAEYDRKRHLPFLSSGLHRPFKIPKLAKRTDKNLASGAKLLPPESINNNLDTKVLTKAENVGGNLVSEEILLKNKTSKCDLKLKNGYQEHSSADLNEPMDVEVHGDQSNISGVAANSLLQAFKQRKVNELHKNHKKSNLNSKSSLQTMSKLSGPENGQSSGNGYSSDGTANSVFNPKVVSHGLNPDFMKRDRKTHDHVPTSSSKGVKSVEYKHLLTVNSCEVKTSKPAKKSSTMENTELKASGKMPDKVPSKHKLKEDIVNEIKKHLNVFYETDLITKEEYKEIVRRSMLKVLQNCGNSINSEKIRKLVVSYVQRIGNTKSNSS